MEKNKKLFAYFKDLLKYNKTTVDLDDFNYLVQILSELDVLSVYEYRGTHYYLEVWKSDKSKMIKTFISILVEKEN